MMRRPAVHRVLPFMRCVRSLFVRGIRIAGWLRPDGGYTALEAAVAAVLLSVVLIPLGAFAVYLALDRSSRQYAQALAAAEAYLEATPPGAAPGRDSLYEGRFVLYREVTAEGGSLRVVVVSAARRSDTPRRTITTLRTARYLAGAQ